MGEVRKPITFNSEKDQKRLQFVEELIGQKRWGTWVKQKIDEELARREVRNKAMSAPFHTTPTRDK